VDGGWFESRKRRIFDRRDGVRLYRSSAFLTAIETGDHVGIQASYWATGGIMTVMALIVGRWVLGLLGAAAVGLGGLLLATMAFLLKAALVLMAVGVLVLVIRRRRTATP
jgi:hypothetical protein